MGKSVFLLTNKSNYYFCMKPLKLSLFIQLITITGFAQKLTQRVYEGQINGKIPIVLTLTNDGNVVYGHVVYVKKGVPIAVIGAQTSGQLFLNELMADGKVTGGYSATIKGDKITGMWFGAKRDAKELTLSLAKTQEKMVAKKTIKDVTGSYSYSFGAGGAGNLRVQQLTPDQIAVSFMNVGSAPAYNQAVINKTVLKLIDNRAT